MNHWQCTLEGNVTMPEIGLQSFSKNSFRKLLRWHPKKRRPKCNEKTRRQKKRRKKRAKLFQNVAKVFMNSHLNLNLLHLKFIIFSDSLWVWSSCSTDCKCYELLIYINPLIFCYFDYQIYLNICPCRGPRFGVWA